MHPGLFFYFRSYRRDTTACEKASLEQEVPSDSSV